jgi:YD repeat-containing protein
MKKYSSPVWMIPLITVSFFFSACSKIRDKINQDCFDVSKFCRIASIDADFTGNGVFEHFQFSYNAAGDPQKWSFTDGENGVDYYFRYDKKGRLTDVLATKREQTSVIVWNRFSYPSPRMIIDSFYFSLGNLNDPHPPYDPGKPGSRTVMQMDEQGRLAKLLHANPDGSDYVYSYDPNGNLILPGVNYDDKVNIYRTSRVWQLLYRDYSRNNPTTAVSGQFVTPAAYNAYGLPTRFLGPFWAIFVFPFSTMNVSYSCDVPVGPHSY